MYRGHPGTTQSYTELPSRPLVKYVLVISSNSPSEHPYPLTSSPLFACLGIHWRNYTLALIFIDFFPFDMQKRVFLVQHYGCPERFPRDVSLSLVSPYFHAVDPPGSYAKAGGKDCD